MKRYEARTGIITYALSGVETGTETLYFKDYGSTEARYKLAKTQLPGNIKLPDNVKLPETNQVTIVVGDTIYSYDGVTKVGTKIENTLDMLGKVKDQDLGKMGMEMIEKMGAKKTGTKDIAGFTCDIYEITNLNSSVCITRNIVLETKASVGNMVVSSVAQKAEFDVTVPEDKFTVPNDITWNSGTDLSKIMEKMKQ